MKERYFVFGSVGAIEKEKEKERKRRNEKSGKRENGMSDMRRGM